MPTHKVQFKEIMLNNGTKLQIKYWTDTKTVYVAAFDESDDKLSVATYQASIDIADDFYSHAHNKTLIEGLAKIVESDLTHNPGMHLKILTGK